MWTSMDLLKYSPKWYLNLKNYCPEDIIQPKSMEMLENNEYLCQENVLNYNYLIKSGNFWRQRLQRFSDNFVTHQ